MCPADILLSYTLADLAHALHSVEDATHSVWLLRSQSANSNTKQGGLGLTDLQFETYPGVGHTYWGGELDDISLWMERVLPMARKSLKGRRAVAHEAEGLRKLRRR